MRDEFLVSKEIQVMPAPISEGAPASVVGALLASALHDERWRRCAVELISGGKSNLTYRVRSEAGDLILRRPPLGHILPTAHDMAREHRVITALGPTSVPVPRTILLADEDGPLGVRWYAMERVLGHVCRNSFPAGYAESPERRRAIGLALVDTLAELHNVDPAAVGLADFGRPAGFMERQLRRWGEQWQRSRTTELPALDALFAALAGAAPSETQAAIVHGDYRLDNAILHPTCPGEIVAVLDWEMSTLGDPLADLAALLAYWAEEDDDEILISGRVVPPLTAAPGFPSRAELVARYAERTGFDVRRLDWYLAFSYMKLAVICQGIAARAAGGAMLGDGFGDAAGLVEPLVAAGRHVLETSVTAAAG
jgi:aminoglycoside phosphotransferase (APT) family kinase protein